MSICRIYCKDIPTSVTKCEALQPQVIRMHEDVQKKLRMVAIRTCGETEQIQDYNPTLTNNTPTNSYELSTETLPTYTFKVINSKSGEVEQTGSGSIQYDTTFNITINALDQGFYRLEITSVINTYTSVCIFPISVCS